MIRPVYLRLGQHGRPLGDCITTTPTTTATTAATTNNNNNNTGSRCIIEITRFTYSAEMLTLLLLPLLLITIQVVGTALKI